MQLFVKDLTVIDSSYLCAERGMVGESWIVDVVLIGGLDQQNMVLDFGLVKKRLKALIDLEVDHKLLIPTEHHGVQVVGKANGMSSVSMETDKGYYALHAPNQAVAQVSASHINEGTVRDHLLRLLPKVLPDNVEQIELTLRPEEIPTPFYHYSHGLKKHDGNCQRIAHGHRSMIEIWLNGIRDAQLELEWAQRWQDIYLASTEDQSSFSQLEMSQWQPRISDESHYSFQYRAEQGLFELSVPKSRVELIETDTTVELLAEYILNTIKAEKQLDKPLKIYAYEGVGKGAIAQDDD